MSELWRELTTVHHADYTMATRPLVAAARELSPIQFVDGYERDLVKSLPRFAREERRTARARAMELAAAYVEQENCRVRHDARLRQEALDQDWSRLISNDPHTVMSVLAESLADNDAVAAPVEVGDDRCNIVMIAPRLEDIPQRVATMDSRGNWTTKKLTAADQSTMHLRCIASNLLATAREAFAVAPALRTATIAVIRNDAPLGAPDWNAYLVARFDGQMVRSTRFTTNAAAEMILDGVADELEVRFRSGSTRLLPLRETDVSGIQRLLEEVTSWTEDDVVTHPGAWHPDPTRRSAHRYWDGSGWTGHVSDIHGLQFTDPL